MPAWQVWVHEDALLRDWAGSSAHVFFDFGDEQALWWLSPNADDIWACVVCLSRKQSIEAIGERRDKVREASPAVIRRNVALIEQLGTNKKKADRRMVWRAQRAMEALTSKIELVPAKKPRPQPHLVAKLELTGDGWRY